MLKTKIWYDGDARSALICLAVAAVFSVGMSMSCPDEVCHKDLRSRCCGTEAVCRPQPDKNSTKNVTASGTVKESQPDWSLLSD